MGWVKNIITFTGLKKDLNNLIEKFYINGVFSLQPICNAPEDLYIELDTLSMDIAVAITFTDPNTSIGDFAQADWDDWQFSSAQSLSILTIMHLNDENKEMSVAAFYREYCDPEIIEIVDKYIDNYDYYGSFRIDDYAIIHIGCSPYPALADLIRKSDTEVYLLFYTNYGVPNGWFNQIKEDFPSISYDAKSIIIDEEEIIKTSHTATV